MFFLYWHKHHVLLCLHVIKEGKATHPICQDLYGPRPIPLRSFLSYTPPVSIKSCFPSFFVKFVSLRWAGPIPECSSAPFYFAFIWFRVQGSGLSWRLRRLFLEDGVLVSQPSPLGNAIKLSGRTFLAPHRGSSPKG